MNPHTQLSPQEWQLLSAYLDGQVSPGERSQIEKKLASEAAFRQAIEELRHTRTVIRSMPRRRAPRNFTLTPEMVTIRRRQGWFPVLRFSSAFAAIASVVLFALQLLPGVINGRAIPAAAPAAMEFTGAQEPAGTEPPLIYWGGPPAEAKGMGGGGGDGNIYPGGMGGGAPDTVFGVPSDAATPSIQFEIPQATSQPGIGAASMPEMPTATVEATPEAPLTLAPQATATPGSERSMEGAQGGPVLGLRPADSGKVIAESQPAAAAEADQSQPAILPRGILLPAAIGLAGLAVLTAIAAIVLKKK